VQRFLNPSRRFDRTAINREEDIAFANCRARSGRPGVDHARRDLIALIDPEHTIVGLRPRAKRDICRGEAEQCHDNGRFQNEADPDPNRPEPAGVRFCL
jgi:hypothetical protein